MQIVLYVLIIASILAGLALAAIGVYGLVKGETYMINMHVGGIKVTGKLARQYSLYYLLGGIVWVFYAILRVIEIL